MMIASETLYSGQITVSVELIKPNYLVLFMSYVLKTKCKPRKKRLPTIFELKMKAASLNVVSLKQLQMNVKKLT